ncbi:MAG: transposase, partial [Thermomicrobia bacterium]|nr:transposase [Thermomicrobia bacterium]
YFVTFRLFGRPGTPRPLSVWERAIVGEALRFWHPARWRLHCYTIMPDHAHLLVTPQEIRAGQWESRSRLVHSVKSYTAHAINAHRGAQGDLWQHESFDRIVRDEQEFDATAHYILHNAVKSGLVADGWEYDGFWYDSP